MSQFPKVSLVKGENRKENITKALGLIEKDIEKAVKEKNSDILFIKINAIDIKFPLACTHPDALETVLELFHDRFDRTIVGDNSYSFFHSTSHPYLYLKEKFEKIEFSGLTEFGSKKLSFKNMKGGYHQADASLLPEKAFTISLSLPKTHDAVVFTGCSKNMVGCVLEGRASLHGTSLVGRLFLNNLLGSISVTHENIAAIINSLKPDLSVMDGFVGMEGEGPLIGKSVDIGIALASEDCVALDCVAASVLGFDKIRYLDICSGQGLNKAVGQTEIVGEDFKHLASVCKKLKRHHLYKYQILEKSSRLPMVDLQFLFSILRRPHRIAAKLIQMMFGKD